MMFMIDSVLLVTGLFLYLDRYQGGAMNLPSLAASFCVFAYAALGFFVRDSVNIRRVRLLLLLLVIQLTVVHSTISEIGMRARTQPHTHVHDHVLQNELSSSFLQKGINPYAADFRGTVLEDWWPENPSLDHVIALPFTILKTVPLQWIAEQTAGRYDDRVSHLLLLAVAIASLYALYRRSDLQMSAIALFCLQPLFAEFFIEGRSDIIFFALLLASLATLRHRHIQVSLLLMALAVTSKHTAWFIAPFYLTHLWSTGYLTPRTAVKRLLPSAALALAIVLPFALWDWGAFYADVYSYAAGTLPTSYHVTGFGLGASLQRMGIILPPFAYTLFQLLLLPWMLWLMRWVSAQPTVGRVMVAYGAFLWPFWFVTRFFNDNYLGVVIAVLGIGVLMVMDEQQTEKTKKRVK